MINLDVLKQKKMDIMNGLAQAIRENNDENLQKYMTDWADTVQEQVIAEAQGIVDTADTTILSARGVRQLTSKEKKFYETFITSAKQSGTITGIDAILPETVIDSVLEDISTNHALLGLINFQNTTAITKMVVNKEGVQQAAWGELTSTISKQLEGSVGVIQTNLSKLSAYMFVSKDMLDLGPQWIDRYVRATLAEACATALEVAIVDGTGKNQPIGMTRSVSDTVTVTGGVYPQKDSITVNALDKVTYGTILSMLSKSPTGRTRTISRVVALVNPVDYFSKVMPATTILLPDGSYRNNVLPFPTDIIQSVGVPEGKMVIGLPQRYFMGVGTTKEGKIEYDDSYKFLEDFRTYIVKLYGTGRPLDDNAFLLLDISDLQDVNPVVSTTPVNETRLSALTFGSLTLSPAFDKNTVYYTTTTTASTNTITATAKDTEATVVIKNGSTTVTNGSAATWVAGDNKVTITVTNGGATRTYTVIVTK